MLTITRTLNIYASGIPQIINLSQYDDDFQIVFNLYTSDGTFTAPSGTTAEVMGTKTDGNGYSATASISGSAVTVTGNKQMTACAGRNVYEIVLTNSNKRLATINFILQVERAALDADTIQSETVLKELNAIIEGAATATQAAEDAQASAEQAAESARTLTIDPTLTQSGQAADAKVTGDEIAGIKEDLNVLEEGGLVLKDDVIARNVTDWLDVHPEATTTVLDESITKVKLNDSLKALLSLATNVEYLGVNEADTPTDALQKINTIIAQSEYNLLVIPSNIDYGYDRVQGIRPNIDLATNRLIIVDFSKDRSYGTSETAGYNATQCRLWIKTPNEENGHHDGNGCYLNANHHPYIEISANGDTNKRASIFFASKNTTNWQIGQGVYADDDDFFMARLISDSQTVFFAVDKETGNMSFGSSYRGLPLAFFKSVTIIPHTNTYITVENSTVASERTYVLEKSLDANGETTRFNGNSVKRTIMNGNPSESYYLPNGGGFISVGFNAINGMYVTNINATKNLFKLKDSGVFNMGVSGFHFTTTNRPTVTEIGTMIFDTSIGKPIWWAGNNWVDANGSAV